MKKLIVSLFLTTLLSCAFVQIDTEQSNYDSMIGLQRDKVVQRLGVPADWDDRMLLYDRAYNDIICLDGVKVSSAAVKKPIVILCNYKTVFFFFKNDICVSWSGIMK